MEIKNAYLQFNDGQKVPLTKERVLVGREEGKCDIVVNDASVSREHAVIVFADGEWYVEDLGSRNKTFVHKKPVKPHEKTQIADESIIHFGFYSVEFHHGKAGIQEEDPDATIAVDMDALKDLEAAAFEKSNRESKTAAQLRSFSAPPAKKKAAPAAPEAAAEDPYAVLELHSVTNPKRYNITKEITGIGTDPSQAEIVIIDSLAAPRHAEIRFYRGKRVTVKKVGQNTVKVNNRPVGEMPLRDKDELEVGESRFTFRLKRYPTTVQTRKQSSKSALIAGGLVVLALIIGGAGLLIYQMNQPSEIPATTNVTTNRTSESRLSDVLDSVATRSYDEAQQSINNLREADNLSAEDKAQLESWAIQLPVLDEAVSLADRGEYARAHERASQLPEDSQLVSAASRELRNIDSRYKSWLRETRRKMEEAEQKENWNEAFASLDLLVAYDKDDADQYAGDRARLNIKREAATVYKNGLQSIETNPERVETDAARLLERMEEQSDGNEQLLESLGDYSQKLSDMKAHAEFLQLYNEFSGDKTVLVAYMNSPGSRYERRADIDARIAKLRKASDLFAEAHRLSREMPTEGATNPESFANIDLIISKYDEVAKLDPSPAFSLGRKAERLSGELKQTRRDEIIRLFNARPEIPAEYTGLRRRLEESLLERKKYYNLLSLFPQEARNNASRQDQLRIIIGDEQLFNLFREAYTNYEGAVSQAAEVLTNAAYERDEDVLEDRSTIFARLENNTFPGDTYGKNRIYNLRKTIDSIIGD